MTAVARRTSPLVAIFNSRDEVIEAIRSALENDGFETVTARLAEIQNGTLDLVAFIKVHAPDVIVYDLPRPYEAHWNFLRLMKETTSLKDRMWILTTTDKEALEAAVGASDASRSSSDSRTAPTMSSRRCTSRSPRAVWNGSSTRCGKPTASSRPAIATSRRSFGTKCVSATKPTGTWVSCVRSTRLFVRRRGS